MPVGRLPTSRSLDFIRPARREKYFTFAVFLVLTGFVSLFGEIFLDGDLAAAAEFLAADSGSEVVLTLAQPPSWLAPGLLFAAFTLPAIYTAGQFAPIGGDVARRWNPSTSDKVPI